MPARPESFDEIAFAVGYTDESAMLFDFYVNQRMSLMDIAKKLGYSPALIRLRLIQHGITLRPKGGWNKRKLGAE